MLHHLLCGSATYFEGSLAIGGLPATVAEVVAVGRMQKGRRMVDTMSVVWNPTDSLAKFIC